MLKINLLVRTATTHTPMTCHTDVKNKQSLYGRPNIPLSETAAFRSKVGEKSHYIARAKVQKSKKKRKKGLHPSITSKLS